MQNLELSGLSGDEKVQLALLLEKLEEARTIESAREEFMPFVRAVWPAFIQGKHHEIMADAFTRVARGELKRLIIAMPPRHTKSEFASYLLPAWFLGKFPAKKIIQASHTAELAVGFGRKVRNLINSDDFAAVFPDTSLSADSKAAGRWNTNEGGEYYAVGVGGAIAGKGADVLIIDDPIDEQTAQQGEYNPEVYNRLYDWYTTGPRQRLQPGGSIIIVATRWSKQDLTGRLMKSGEWEVIEFPAIMPSGGALWPEFWSIDELEKIRADIPVSKWEAQYQQSPTSEEGALVKRDWWKMWEKSDPPPVSFVIQSWDTAFLKTERADYSACTTWGVFAKEGADGTNVSHIILLDAFRDKLEFPELKAAARELHDKWKPDSFIVEAKAAGAPLIFELRAMGIPVEEFTPSRGNDKISRLNAVSDMFKSGFIWATKDRWAEEVINEVAEFPSGEHDDYVDSTTQALLRFRQGGFLTIPSDFNDTEEFYRPRAAYY